jgi:hypothetical protein
MPVMNSSLRRRGSKPHRPNFLLTSQDIFISSRNWLADLIRLTEAEQKSAGVYFDNPITNYYQEPQYINQKDKHNGQ